MRRAAPATILATALTVALIGLPKVSRAQFAAEQKQAQCELATIRDTRSVVAIQTIRSACNWLALNEGSLLNESLRPYYLCLLQNLSGVQDDRAAGVIASACRTANRL
jgi:hypothetical protein